VYVYEQIGKNKFKIKGVLVSNATALGHMGDDEVKFKH
jgi:hypothetical protein